MNRCEHCQSLLLEHLYDLLEGDERQQFTEHLEQCPTCQAALVRARGQQRLLQAAAKKQFPAVHFEAPATVAPEHIAPAVVRMPVRRRNYLRWAAAAAALLFAVGLALPAARHWSEYSTASRAVQNQQVAIAGTQRQMGDLSQKLRALPQTQNERLVKVQEQVNEQRLKLEVSGPENFQPGAHNEFRIQAKNLNDKTVKASIDVRVRDEASQRLLHQEEGIAFEGEHRLILPRNLPVNPNTRLALEVVARRERGEAVPQSQLSAQLELAPPLYLTHLTTDKPMYQPGEVVRYRSLTLERFTLKPAEEPFQLIYTLTFPKGEEVVVGNGNTQQLWSEHPQNRGRAPLAGPDGKPVRGIGVGEFPLDPGMAGGEYTLTVRDASERFPAQQRKFVVNRYQPHRLNKELDYARKSFGPGEEVIAVCKAERTGFGPVANRPVEATVQIDGQTYGADGKENAQPLAFRTDDQGKVEVRFKLPAAIDKGEASLSVKFNDGGSIEAITRPIPIVLKKLNVEFFPEGGDLVAGVPNRVYFQARSTLGKPADLKGHIVDADGKAVTETFETLSDKERPGVNQGQGLFAFTPEAGKKYELKIETPAGMEGKYALPAVKDEGVVLSVPEGVFRADEPVRVVVQSAGKDRTLMVGGYCRGRLLDHQMVIAKKGEAATVILKPSVSVGGVYRVTVFEERPGPGNRREFLPLAERLVYRKPLQRLEMALHTDKAAFIPGEKAKVTVTSVTEDDVPAPAIVMVAVVDKSVLAMADEKTRRAMPTHFYLGTEVRKAEELEYADFLVAAHPRAKEALDLLLGTQGWRRFAEQNPEEFQKKYREEAERLLVSNGQALRDTPLVVEGQPAPETIAFERSEQQKVFEGIQKERQELVQKRTEEQRELQDQQNDADYRAALAVVSKYKDGGRTARAIGVPLLSALLVVLAVACFILAVLRGVSRPAIAYAISTACVVLFAGLVAFELKGRKWEDTINRTNAGPMAMWDDRANMEMDKGRRHMAPVPDMALEEAAANADKPADAREFGAVPPPMVPAQLNRAGEPMPGAAMPAGKDGRFLGDEQLRRRGDLAGRAGALKAKGGDAKQAREAEEQRNLAMDKFQKEADGVAFGAKKDMDAERFDRANARRPLQEQAGGFGERPGRGAMAMPAFVVRQYAHSNKPAKGAERHDFTETVYWHPVLVLPSGKGEVEFDLSDNVTTFEVLAYGHTLDGRLGAVSTTLQSRLPFTLEPKVPIEVTSSDKIDVPVSIANNTTAKRDVSVRVEHQGLKLLAGKEQDNLALAGDERTRRIFRFQPSLLEGPASLLFEGKTEPFAADRIRRNFVVVPEGFPFVGSKSDMLEGSASNDLVLPETWVHGTLKVQVQVFPSTLASLQKGLDSLLREPSGCFEQTSTSNYPNVLILDYLKENDLARPEIDRRARDLMGKGYQKLTSFECQNTAKKTKEGYEWFGGRAPAHEALTAYGLLQFRDMARVFDVDPVMVERTRKYLMSQRDGQGGFKRNTRALDTFGRAPENVTNAYIVWALTESGKDDDLEKELSVLSEQAKNSKDPYFVSLVANALLNRDKSDTAIALLKTVATVQKPDGHLEAEKTSITGSGGRDLQIETTGLAVLGWLKANRPADFNVNVQNAVKWIGQQRGGYGGFGSTQSTILALKALIAHTKANKRPAEAGELKLFVGEQEVGKLAFGTDAQDALTLAVPEAEKQLKAGKNALRVEMTGKSAFPYTLSWSYRTLKPASADAAPVKLSTKLSKTTADEGDAVRLTVNLENVSGKGQGMAVAIIGLPAGMNVPENLKQLKDHCLLRDNDTKPGLISAFEIRGRELVLYWRDLAPDQKIEVPIDLDCRVPGEYRGPASRAYLYYNADHKHWIDPLTMTIQAKAE